MQRLIVTLLVFFFAVSPALAENGLISLKSAHSVKQTADRLENALLQKNMTVFNRINHAQGAQKAGIPLRPMELLIFGNPKVGAPLMQCSQTAGIDLPQKALIRQDEEGTVWLTYNDPKYMANRHGITECGDVVAKFDKALRNFATMATTP